MGKGILLELEGRKAVVLTPQGEFKRVAVPAGTWDIGDEVEYADVRPVPWQRWGAIAAAACLMLLVAPLAYDGYVDNFVPYAVVTVDINPSLRLEVNRKEQVLAAEGLNADGERVLQGVSFKRRPVEEVLAEVTARAVEEQKLNPADEYSAVVVAVAPAKAAELPAVYADSVAVKARQAVAAKVEEKARAQNVQPKTNVAALEATPEVKAEAEKQGLTVGKFIVWQKIRQVVPEVKPEEIKVQGPGAVMRSLHLNPGAIFEKAEQEHGPKGDGKDDRQNKKGSEEKGDQARPAIRAGGKPADGPRRQEDRTPPGQEKGRDKGKDDAGTRDEKEDYFKLGPVEIPKPGFLRPKGEEKEQEKDRERDREKEQERDQERDRETDRERDREKEQERQQPKQEGRKPRAEAPGDGSSGQVGGPSGTSREKEGDNGKGRDRPGREERPGSDGEAAPRERGGADGRDRSEGKSAPDEKGNPGQKGRPGDTDEAGERGKREETDKPRGGGKPEDTDRSRDKGEREDTDRARDRGKPEEKARSEDKANPGGKGKSDR